MPVITPTSEQQYGYDPLLPTIFLAGTIDNGESYDWQQDIIRCLEENYVVFSPRRAEWDANASSELIFEQINWELDRIREAETIFIYFAPGSKSPISLLELGLVLANDDKLVIVVCPDGFWRKDNVFVTTTRFGHQVYNSLGEGLEALQDVIGGVNFP